jgi:hypothetical protein
MQFKGGKMRVQNLFRLRAQLLVLLVSLLAISLSGCIEIREEYYFREDGSGRMRLTWDLSGLQAMAKAMQEMGKSTASDKAEKTEKDMRDVAEELGGKIDPIARVEGVSAVKVDSSGAESAMISISYDFEDIEALNKALYLLYQDDEQPKEVPETLPDSARQITMENGEIVHNFLFADKIQKSMKEDQQGEDEEEEALKSSPGQEDQEEEEPRGGPRGGPGGSMGSPDASVFTYQAVFSFEKEVASVRGSNAKPGLDGRSVMINTSLGRAADAPVRIQLDQ